MWQLGEVERARQLAQQALQSAASLGHVPTSALAYPRVAILEAQCNDPAAVLRSADMLLGHCHIRQEWAIFGGFHSRIEGSK